MQRKIAIRIRRLDRVPAGCISKHAIARHLNIEDMLLPIAPSVRDDPLHPLPTPRQTLERVPVLRPDEALIIRIPVELKPLLFTEPFGDRQADAEPVRRPAGPEGGADVRGLKLVGSCFLETGPLQIGNGIDGELDVVSGGGRSFEKLAVVVVLAALRVVRYQMRGRVAVPATSMNGENIPNQILLLVLTARCKLAETVSVDAPDALSDGAFGRPGQRAGSLSGNVSTHCLSGSRQQGINSNSLNG
jgi:hypothetical protein